VGGFPVEEDGGITVIDQFQAQQLVGQTLRTTNGDKIGTIGQVYIDDYHGQPEWVTVNTGFFGSNESFVPLAEANLSGSDVVVPYAKDQIKNAPNISDSGHLSEVEEQDLYQHYNVPFSTEGSTFAETDRTGQDTDRTGQDTDRPGRDTSGYAEDTTERTAASRDASGAGTDEAMTRSEERLNVGAEQVEAGRARLRKWVETEQVQVDVPVKREKAVLVSEPITDANRGDALSGPEISEQEHEVVLNEERPVVSKEAVPVERVRLDKQVQEEVVQAGGDVRKERIEVEGDVDTNRTGRH
jgi:uncharacterized protein (TIGR02271 family)